MLQYSFCKQVCTRLPKSTAINDMQIKFRWGFPLIWPVFLICLANKSWQKVLLLIYCGRKTLLNDRQFRLVSLNKQLCLSLSVESTSHSTVFFSHNKSANNTFSHNLSGLVQFAIFFGFRYCSILFVCGKYCSIIN